MPDGKKKKVKVVKLLKDLTDRRQREYACFLGFKDGNTYN
jgi:hypothetical protein